MLPDLSLLRSRRSFTQWEAAFELLLEQFPHAAFLVSTRGEFLAANAAGQERLRAFPELVSELHEGGPLAAAECGLKWVEGGHPSWGFRLWLEVPPHTSEDAVDRAAQRWQLTRRQREVVALLLEGMSNDEMAEALQCSPRTIEVHLGTVLQKSGKESRGAVVAALWRMAFGEAGPGGSLTRFGAPARPRRR
jgi:DNA-binding CsgD family transcriptional regulator